ncbi:transmembrane protein 177 [Lycorma delicatula]|uniref:transmembrane protein 177 n=1 Tax=Lycorma delicatula TaxID=130591 RepID=UPI003F514CC9
MSKLLKFSAETGEKFLTYSLVSVGLGTVIAQVAPHVWFLDNYAGLFQLYKKGFAVEVPSHFETMLSEISDDLAIPVKNPLTRLLTVIGFDTMHFGTTSTTSGCFIGIPVNFNYKSEKDIDKLSIQVGNKSVPWDSKDGIELANSLILSDAAKRFGIAYELSLVDTFKFYLHCFSGPVIVIICGGVNNYFCNIFGLPYRPFPVKGVFYGLLIAFGIGFYYLSKDLITTYYEMQALKNVSKVGEEYITGGLEFYDKLLARNKALRNLLPDGSSEFNTDGDSIYLFRKKHVPITVKKQLLEKELEKLNHSNII